MNGGCMVWLKMWCLMCLWLCMNYVIFLVVFGLSELSDVMFVEKSSDKFVIVCVSKYDCYRIMSVKII